MSLIFYHSFSHSPSGFLTCKEKKKHFISANDKVYCVSSGAHMIDLLISNFKVFWICHELFLFSQCVDLLGGNEENCPPAPSPWTGSIWTLSIWHLSCCIWSLHLHLHQWIRIPLCPPLSAPGLPSPPATALHHICSFEALFI